MSELTRYGLQWDGPNGFDFIYTEMADGYWTPWHIAQAQLAAAEAEADQWEAEAQRYATNLDYWRERCAAAEADAERYRWWVKHGWFYRGMRCLQETSPLRGEIGVGEGQTKKQAIDAAVDAAIQATAPEREGE